MMIKHNKSINKFYVLHDSDQELKKKGAFPVSLDQAKELNKQGYTWRYATDG